MAPSRCTLTWQVYSSFRSIHLSRIDCLNVFEPLPRSAVLHNTARLQRAGFFKYGSILQWSPQNRQCSKNLKEDISERRCLLGTANLLLD